MNSVFVVAHNNQGYAYIREVFASDTVVYCDYELGTFKTLKQAESFVLKVDLTLEKEWLEHLA